MICKNTEKCHPRSIICILMYTGLTVIAFHILIIGPIKDLVKHETVFTESLQNINGKIFRITEVSYFIKSITYFFNY